MLNKLSLLFPPLYLPPIIGIAIAYISGIFIYSLSINNSLLFGPIIATLSICFWKLSNHRKILTVYVLFLFLGYWRSYDTYSSYKYFPFENYKTPVTIIGTVTGNSLSNSRMKHCFTIFAQESVDDNNKKKPINNTLQIYVAKKPSIKIGDQIAIHNVQLKAPGSTPFKEYLIKEGILTNLFLTNFSYKIIHRPSYSIHRWIWELRNNLVNNLAKKLTPPVYAFFCAIFLGNRSINKPETENISDQFKQWGAVHYMVRAGLHLVMFVGIWYALLSFIPINFAAKQIVMLIICFLYYLLSWSSIAFIRAFLTFIFYKFAMLLNLNTHSLHIITLITLFVLFLNPTQLFFLDFQLSFCVTFALAWFNHMYISPPAAQPL